MNVEILKEILKTQKQEIQDKLAQQEIIERQYLGISLKYLKAPNILTILGVRRSGKSFLAMQISQALKQTTGYVNFEDERLASITTQDLNKVLQAIYEVYGNVELVVLDEVQNVPKWELFAARLRRTKKVIITGSNSKLLSGELATHLTGRHIDITIYPFSFKEFSNMKTFPDVVTTLERAKIKAKLEEYVKGSGFPEYKIFGKQIIRTIYNDIIFKDCILRYNIKKENTFTSLAHYLVSNFSKEISFQKLAKIFKLGDVHTAKNYVSYLQNAYAIFLLKRFSYKLKEQELAAKKVYNIDQGFSNFIAFNTSNNKSLVFENIVAVQLLRNNTLLEKDSEIYYWKSPEGYEVDFVVKEGSKVKQLIQVCYDLQDENTRKRELRALIKASKELRCKDLLVITNDFEDEQQLEWFGKKAKIKFIPLWKWLLFVKPAFKH